MSFRKFLILTTDEHVLESEEIKMLIRGLRDELCEGLDAIIEPVPDL